MTSKISNWKLYTLESEYRDYTKFEINKLTYYLPNNVNVNGKKNVFTVQFDPKEVVKKKFVEKLENSLKKFKIKKIFFRLNPIQTSKLHLSKAIKKLQNEKYIMSKINLILLDLKKDNKELRKNLRKSYKSLINKESKSLNILFSNENKFRKKLFQDWVSIYSKAILRGNKILSEKTYNILEKAIYDEECLLSIAYDKKEPVGGMLFSLSKNFAIYESSANIAKVESDRTRSVGHFLMWNSILKLKEIGINYFELGTYYDVIPNTIYLKNWIKKETGITNFKKGFGAEIISSYYFAKENI